MKDEKSGPSLAGDVESETPKKLDATNATLPALERL